MFGKVWMRKYSCYYGDEYLGYDLTNDLNMLYLKRIINKIIRNFKDGYIKTYK